MRTPVLAALSVLLATGAFGCARRHYYYAPAPYYTSGGYYAPARVVYPRAVYRQPIVIQQPPPVYYTAPQPGYAQPAVYNGTQIYVAQ